MTISGYIDLLDSLEKPETADAALDGLRHIITLRAAVILPYLIPKLTKPPISTFNSKALSSIAEVAGPSLYPHLGILLPCLIEAMQPQPDVGAEVRPAAKDRLLCACTQKLSLTRNSKRPGLTVRGWYYVSRRMACISSLLS